ncbi:MAG: FHA domain-containing protein [Bdellovibrio sp.]
MVVFIEVIEGPYEGSRFKVEAGLTIGRSKADIVVKDPKISSTHAQFAVDGKGQFVLMDLNSANGLHINGRRVKKVALLQGVMFEVGRTQFKVVSVEEDLALDFSRLITWRTALKDRLSALLEDVNDGPTPTPNNLQNFSPALRLTFIQGIQAEEELVLGYGPRRAGAASLDIELKEKGSPEKAFEILPGPGSAFIKNHAPQFVTLNNQAVTTETLKEGDLICFGHTQIKVSYL